MSKANYKIETELKELGFKYIVGTDEAGRGCEHPSAEVLTSSGWKFYTEIKESDKVLSFSKSGNLVWQNINFVLEKDFVGDLVSLRNRSINMLVTPDHHFDVLRRKFRRDKNHKLKLIGYTYGRRCSVPELKDNDYIPRGGVWYGEDAEYFVLPAADKLKFDHSGKSYSEKYIPMDLWLKFIGIYLAEGSVTHSKNGAYVVSIKQVKRRTHKLIYDTLKDLPFEVFDQKDRIVIYNKQLYEYLLTLGKTADKYIPKEFKDLPPNKLQILVDWLLLGDGASYKGRKRRRVFVYYTTSKKLRDDFEELVLKLGKTYKTSIRSPRDAYINERKIPKENCSDCYEIRIRQNIKAHVKSLHTELVPYSGKVFCLGLPEHHNFYVRRDGSGYFSGNCGAGPVVAAAVLIPDEAIPKLMGQVNDSKKVAPAKRERLYDEIMSLCIVGAQDVSAVVIDEINILEATKLAMARAIEQIDLFDYLLIDGTVDLSKYIACPQQQVIKGDAKSISIAAASIIAKVYRDHIMNDLHDIYPLYNFKKNKGYLVQEHIEAIRIYGPTNIHRLTFRKVKDFM